MYKSSTKPPPFLSFVHVFAFAYNAKNSPLFFTYFSFSSLFLDDLKNVFQQTFFRFITQKECSKIGFILLNTLKYVSVKIAKLLFLTRVAHDIRLFTATSIDSIRESTRNSQKHVNRLGRRWKKIQESKGRNQPDK